ncbi:single-minded homolog 2-like [Littorina saxatilis]|uniref:single-minded homolog 2-like n=1 Tax=Littorina saxatilis TaxID=31220 RepID=UPI0038B4FE87
MPPSPIEELALLDLDRSNKGASKQQRDQINSEIAVMRDLLPLPETARQRLSQLQVMSLCCVYIRKCNVLNKLFRSLPAEKDVHTATCDFFQALTGFLLITTREGKLVYISENVTDYLGHSMVDMKTQGDSLYDIVDKRDHGTVQAQLLAGGAELDVTRDVAFFCRMNMSRTLKRQAGFGDVKVMHVRGHFVPLSDPNADVTEPQQQQQQQQQQQKYVFMATCSPLITPELKENLIQSNTMVFKTVHQLDMTFLEVTKTAEYHLGLSTEEICQKSWYSMLHPEDIHEAREKHILLIRSNHEMGCMMTVRMLSAEGQTLWVNCVMHVRQAATAHNDDPLIVCINQVISEEEAYQIRMQSHMFTLYPPRAGDLWAAGLNGSHTATHPHTMQPDTATRWMPPTPVAPTNQPVTYQGPKPAYYMAGTQRLLPPSPCTNTYPAMHDQAGYMQPSSSSSPPSTLPNPHPHGQTDKLKLMLKRKIQGPCCPAKIPKLIWEDNVDSSGHPGHMEYAATADPMHSPDSASHFMGHNSRGYSWPAPTHVIPRAQYRVMPLLVQQPLNVKARIMATSALSPPHSTPHTTEQVVPESSVAVPESFLTPDPSPASSPHPPSMVKSEPMERKSAPSSTAILQELEKLASFTRAEPLPLPTPAPIPTITIKREKSLSPPVCRQKKELPIMDAFDIDQFFDLLVSPSTDLDTKKQHAALPKVINEVGNLPVTTPVVAVPRIKQEPVDTEPAFLAHKEPVRALQSPAVPPAQPVPALQSPAVPPAQPSQPCVDPKELEDLLGFFSGDMTATQLDLSDTLLTSTAVKEDGDLLVDSIQAFADNYGQVKLPCSAGHLGHFLSGLERPLEDFSPLSSSDVSSDMSGDEESCSEDSLQALLTKPEGGDRHGPAPSLGPTHPQTPQDVPGMCEEDELYQLDKLLLSMASNSGLMVSEETQ